MLNIKQQPQSTRTNQIGTSKDQRLQYKSRNPQSKVRYAIFTHVNEIERSKEPKPKYN